MCVGKKKSERKKQRCKAIPDLQLWKVDRLQLTVFTKSWIDFENQLKANLNKVPAQILSKHSTINSRIHLLVDNDTLAYDWRANLYSDRKKSSETKTKNITQSFSVRINQLSQISVKKSLRSISSCHCMFSACATHCYLHWLVCF